MSTNNSLIQAKKVFLGWGHFSLAVMVICLVITLVKPDLPEMANLALLFSFIGGFFCMVLFYSGGFFFIQMDKQMAVRHMSKSPLFNL